MAEYGWYHSSRGYWQTTGIPAEEYLASYPEGTVEVPVKPGANHLLDEQSLTWVEPSDETKAEIRLVQAKSECRKRIYAVASGETQMNLAAAAAVIAGKAGSSRSADEKKTLAGIGEFRAWVATMQATCASLAADASLDIGNDGNWPECPDGALEILASH